ncbi:methyl-CpG-binding domain protein 5-like [Anopheles nili]|uniref:methyl-CpG-binding domain protein 5-like n=1 Tax=Anopheles nili TaxID=185578 RepID=UPI00237B206A|nr:methyl-CpG-binding domain protein 5-like [Anopheles nili]
MAAARADNSKKQDDKSIKSIQHAKPALPPQRYPIILLNGKKQPTNALSQSTSVSLSSRQNVLHRLGSLQPRLLQQEPEAQLPVSAGPTMKPSSALVSPTTAPGHRALVPSISVCNAAPVIINSESLRRTVYTTLPPATLHSSNLNTSTGTSVDGVNSIVSFADKPAVTIPVPSTTDGLISVVRPTSGGTVVPPVSSTPNANSFSKQPNTATNEVKLSLVAKLPIKNGETMNSSTKRTINGLQSVTIANRPNGVTAQASIQYNNAPGWRRILRNKVIVYISPSNAVLHNFDQVKEYLLTAGTCKCGLPCPFYPEVFFQFDAEIPNLSMPPRSKQVESCTHLKAMVTGSERTKRVHTETIANNVQRIACGSVHRAQSAILLKTPPWRKNIPIGKISSSGSTLLPTAINQSFPAKIVSASDTSLNTPVQDRLDSLVTKVTCTPKSDSTSTSYAVGTAGHDASDKQPPLKDPVAMVESDKIDCKSRTIPTQKKKPTFKDDPTGYLNQQTAILHNSISILHSPDRRSPLTLSELSPKATISSSDTQKPVQNNISESREITTTKMAASNPSKDDHTCTRRQRTVNRILPKIRLQQTQLTGPTKPLPSVLRFEAESTSFNNQALAITNSITSKRVTDRNKTLPITRITSQNENSKMTYFVHANSTRPTPIEHCSSAKVAKLNVSTTSESLISVPNSYPMTSTTTTTTIARTNPTTTATATMLVSSRSTQLINTGGAQIVVIDGLQHSAMPSTSEVNRVRITGFHPSRQQATSAQIQQQQKQQLQHEIQPKEPHQSQQQPNIINYNLPRGPNNTTGPLSNPTVSTMTSAAMVINGANIIHLSNGLQSSNTATRQLLSTYGGVLTSNSSCPTSSNQCLSQNTSALGSTKTPLTLTNGSLGLASGPTVVLNPTTSIRFTDSSNLNTSGTFTTSTVPSGFDKLSCGPESVRPIIDNFQYPPCSTSSTNGSNLATIEGRKIKKQMKNVLSDGTMGTTTGISSGIVLPPSSITALNQPQSAFQQQLHTPFVQIAAPYGGLQNIQLASNLSGITVVPVTKSAPIVLPSPTSSQHTQPQQHQQQQHQQPYNLLGQTQTILLPAGSMVMTSDATSPTTTLLQIQNMGACTSSASLLTNQSGIVLRHPKPTPTSFLSTVGSQSFLIGANSGSSTARSVSMGQRQLTATSGATLFGTSATAPLGIVTAQSLTVGSISIQQAELSLTPSSANSTVVKQPDISAKIIDASKQIDMSQNQTCGKVLLHCDVTSQDLSGSSGDNNYGSIDAKIRNCSSTRDADRKPAVYNVKNSMRLACSTSDVPAVTAIESDDQIKSWRNVTKQGRLLLNSPDRTCREALSEERVTGISERRGVTSQPTDKHLTAGAECVKLNLTIPQSTTEGSLCLFADLPDQSYDTATPLIPKSPAKSRKRRLARSELSAQPSADTTANAEQDETIDSNQCIVSGEQTSHWFRVGDLVWGAVRGFPAWPGKVLPSPPPSPSIEINKHLGECTSSSSTSLMVKKSVSPTDAAQQKYVWVRWFGTGRTNAERVEVATLQSLSEGLESHHRALKDTRKSRKLNSHLEYAIQQAMQELDQTATTSGLNRRGSTVSKQQRRRRRRKPGKHRTSSASSMCNKRTASVRYLRGNKFKAKS